MSEKSGNIFLRRPVTAIVISVVILMVGTLAILQMPVSQYPNITPPTVSIHDTLVKFLEFPSPPADEEVPEMLRPYFLRFFRTFLEPSADLAINVIGSTMQDVATKISTEDYRINMFETARNEVLHLLYGNTFHFFAENYKEIIQSRLEI